MSPTLFPASASTWSLPLRGYQEEAIAAFKTFVAAGGKRGIVNLPVGTGKTILGLALAARTGRTLWIAHTEELVTQPLEKARDAWPGGEFGLVRAGDDNFDARDLVVASMQTIARATGEGKRLERLARIASAAPLSLIVIDEAHHALPDNSYGRVLEALPGVPVLGLTATVERGDGLALGTLWEKVAHSYQLLDAIRDGALAPPRLPFAVDPIEGLRLTKEERAKAKTDAAVEKIVRAKIEAHLSATAAETVSKTLAHLADRRRVLVFTVLTKQAEETAKAFTAAGWPAACVSGETPRAERRESIRAFKAGELRVLASPLALTEGFDSPGVDGVVLARPFASKTLFLQALGRATRLAPGKTDWGVLDLSECTLLHDPFHSAPLLDGQGKDASDEERDGAGGGGIANPFSGRDREPPPQVRWVRAGLRGFAAPAGKGVQVLVALEPSSNRWTVRVEKGRGAGEDVGAYRDRELALGVGADAVRRLGGLRYGGEKEAEGWRRRPVSEKQRETLRRMHIDVAGIKTAGDASDAITEASTRRRLSRARANAMKARERVQE